MASPYPQTNPKHVPITNPKSKLPSKKPAPKKVLNKKSGKKPVVVIAKTIAGKGVKKIENTLLAHYFVADDESRIKTKK